MPATPNLTVLIVDDERLLRWALAELLRRHGHVVLEAENAQDARLMMTLTTYPIAVVFLDYRLPDSMSLALLAEMRHRLPQTAIVFMTAFGAPEVMQEAKALGAYRVLNKPFDLNEIPALVINAARVA